MQHCKKFFNLLEVSGDIYWRKKKCIIFTYEPEMWLRGEKISRFAESEFDEKLNYFVNYLIEMSHNC